MNEALKQRLHERRGRIYAAVRAADPDMYKRAVEIGHLALPVFERDENKRAANVEAAVMSLIADILGVVP